MLADLTDLLIGAGGTVLYLVAWQRLTPACDDAGSASRHRRRLVRILFFVALTPYLLALFWLMERAREWIEPAAAATAAG